MTLYEPRSWAIPAMTESYKAANRSVAVILQRLELGVPNRCSREAK
jgi:hypothetical protein